MSKKIRILAKLNGGFGTVLVRANYIYCLCRYLDFDKSILVDVVGHKSQVMNDAIFKGLPGINRYYGDNDWESLKEDAYDLVFIVDMYPKILKLNRALIDTNEKLRELILTWESFMSSTSAAEYYRNQREAKPYEMRKLMNRHKFVLNSADIGNLLDIGEDYSIKLNVEKSKESVLDRFNLRGKKFITIQRGINPKLKTTESPKMWSTNKYEEVIELIKNQYPEYLIVQLGESTTHCKELNGIDISAVGETDWDDLKILLQEASLHIDGECGMVHLRKALNGGPSVVLFSITPKDYFGYEGNINIVGDGCKSFCCEINTGWEYRCLRGYEKAPCIESISSQYVFDLIKKYFGGDRSVLYTRQKSNLFEKNCSLLINKYGKYIDKDYARDWLWKQHIYYVEECSIKVSDLLAHVYLDDNKWNLVPIDESPAFNYVSGNSKDSYIQNMNLRDNNLDDNIHSVARYDTLINSLNDGINDLKILIDEKNLIKDGQHRAAWWMYKYGPDSEIPAIRMYLSN